MNCYTCHDNGEVYDLTVLPWQGLGIHPIIPCPDCRYVTKSGKVLTNEDIEALAEESERGYTLADLERGRIAPPKRGPWGPDHPDYDEMGQ